MQVSFSGATDPALSWFLKSGGSGFNTIAALRRKWAPSESLFAGH